MIKRYIVRGQKIDSTKKRLSKEFRSEMTPAERVLWQSLRRNQLKGFHFRREQIIDGFIVDFYCHAAGLVIEVDGSVHDDQRQHDAERESILVGRELRVIRFRNEEVLGNLQDVLRRIAENLTPQPPSLEGKGELESGETDR